ncbi:putative DNA-binding transcriptional regulator [Aquisphaera giovannonii]|uniref:Putative DNA-binding transcriptional regulator n=1 Tax=Aquisphaera giovannonii TaxID=406548 RepID=A0A5B9W6P1_9BACT|nr:CerR family C-terminal domain-containing protein [Aquisphaera giovannonii]QEH36273.1 putative DNA-binding transcriptional regulator [Aquisphaera giovannonii]
MSQDPTKARLIEAAGQEFASRGFEQATVRAICERAGANLAAVNYHFGDKGGLYTEVLHEAHRCGRLEMEEVEALGGSTPADRLRAFIRLFLERVLVLGCQPGWQHQLMLREMFAPTAYSEALVRDVIRPRFEYLKGVLAELCPEADDRRLNALVFSVIGQCLHYKFARRISEHLIGAEGLAGLDAAYLADHIASFCLAALGEAPTLNRAGEAHPIHPNSPREVEVKP